VDLLSILNSCHPSVLLNTQLPVFTSLTIFVPQNHCSFALAVLGHEQLAVAVVVEGFALPVLAMAVAECGSSASQR